MEAHQLNAGDITEADLNGVEWLKVTEESLLGDTVNYWNVGEKMVDVYRGEDGKQTNTTKMLAEAVTALNNDVDSSAAAEVTKVEAIDADGLPAEIDA